MLIRWAVQRGTSVLPKSTDPERIASNLAVLDWSLGEADMAELSSLDYQARMVAGAFLLSPQGPYRYAHKVALALSSTLPAVCCSPPPRLLLSPAADTRTQHSPGSDRSSGRPRL